MNGLRMFILPDQDTVESNVFYSQRGRGPMYRWHFVKENGRWQVARVDAALSSTNRYSNASWKSVPQNLKAQLIEHYLE